MSETEKRKIKVFIASPNDLAEERRIFRSAIDVLNIGFGDGANVEFIPLGWEDTLASTGRRSQGVINQDIDSCDVFILAMHRRWGQDAPDAAPYSSYTEEEFHRALERWKSSGSPEIFVFFKRVDAASEADPGPQLSKVIKFRQHLEETRQILYRYFDSSESFLDEVDTHLRAYVKGELPKAELRDDMVVLPIAALQEVEKAKQEVLQKTEEAKQAKESADEVRLQLEEMQLQMAEVAAQLAKEGKIEFAREKFTKLVVEATNFRILFLAYEFFKRTGDLDSTITVLEKWLNLSDPEDKSAENAAAIGNLANLYRVQGDYRRSEEMYQKSLAIFESLDNKKGMANSYCNLAILYEIRGDLNRAEDMYEKSLFISEPLDYKEGLVNIYGNLGVLYEVRGEYKRAEDMYRKALSIAEILGYKEGLAGTYCNLGNLYLNRGEFEKAKDMYQRALPISEALGNKEGMARDFGNLGNYYLSQGDLERTEEMYLKSLAINEALSRTEGMAIQYCNLGIVYQILEYLDRAEEMYEKSIVLFHSIKSPKAKEVEERLRKLRNGESPSEDCVKA